MDELGQVGAPAEEDLKNWGQHLGTATVPDAILREVGAALPGFVSFVFTCQARAVITPPSDLPLFCNFLYLYLPG